MKQVSIYELRDNLATYLQSIEKFSTPIIVRRYDVPIAVIMPYKPENIFGRVESLFGFLGSRGDSGKKHVDRIRRNAREKNRTDKLRHRR